MRRIEELKTTIADRVVDLEIRKRSARVQVLQDKLNRMCSLIELRAEKYRTATGECEWRRARMPRARQRGVHGGRRH